MTDSIDPNESRRIVHSEKDTILSFSDSVTFLLEKLLYARGTGIRLQRVQAITDQPNVAPRKIMECAFGIPLEQNRVLLHARPFFRNSFLTSFQGRKLSPSEMASLRS